MPSTTGTPDLIILLSQDQVEVRLWENHEAGSAKWVSGFNVRGLFLEDQVSAGMDKALLDNPALLDQFETVEILVVDRPGIILPETYAHEDTIADIAGRYLRSRAGDFLATDRTPGEIRIAYSLPVETIQILREYYANAGFLHLTSIIWSTLSSHERLADARNRSRLFFLNIDSTLVVLGESDGQLTFARNFKIHGPGDLVYYSLACSLMLKVDELWQITLTGETPRFEMPFSSFFSFQHRLELPSLHHLIARHRVCAS